jgi:predicted ATPase
LIRTIELENVRIFEGGPWTFPLTPLTVLCGTNSAGKSTVLKVLLLLRQSLGIHEGFGPVSAKIRFTGSQVDLGNYRSFVSHNQTNRDCTIGVTVDGEMPRPLLRQLQATEDTFESSTAVVGAKDRSPKDPVEVRCEFKFGRGADYRVAPERVSDKEGETEDRVLSDHEAILKRAQFTVAAQGKSLLTWEVVLRSMDPGRFPDFVLRLPRDYFERYGGLASLDLGEEREQILELDTYVWGVLPDRIFGAAKQGSAEDQHAAPGIRSWPLPPHIEQALRILRRSLVNVTYLGPLRAPARRYYTLQTDLTFALDPAGEFLPYLLRDGAENTVYNVLIDGKSLTRQRLTDALDYWLHYLRTGAILETTGWHHREVSVENFQDVLVQIELRGLYGRESHSILDSGFGYSQVLPILARGLMMDPGDTLIVEEPEAHLNPALQVRMAHFLGCMARAGKQILIETHSEHIVNALRVMSAEDATEIMPDISKIFYLDVGVEKLTVQQLPIRKDGTVPDWPRSFFGEAASLAGRLLRAQVTPVKPRDLDE